MVDFAVRETKGTDFGSLGSLYPIVPTSCKKVTTTVPMVKSKETKFGETNEFGDVITRTTIYNTSNNEDENLMIKGHVENLQFILENEWNGDEFAKEWQNFRNDYMQTGQYKNKIYNREKELIAEGLSEEEAKEKANKYGEMIVFDRLANTYKEITGKDLKKAIKSQFWFDRTYQKYIAQLKDSTKKPVTVAEAVVKIATKPFCPVSIASSLVK